MINSFKELVIKQFGKKIESAKDCSLLSKDIFNKTSRNISTTTLRRFFGLHQSKYNVSKYNLDSLAKYCNFSDYNEFVESKNRTEISQIIKQVKENFDRVTLHTTRSISKRSILESNLLIERKHCFNSLDSFISSEENLFALIAQGGYGKSIALSKWIKKKKSKTDNLILFSHASLINSYLNEIENHKYKINLNPESPDNLFNLLEKENQLNKQILIVIDSVDELFYQSRRIEKFAEKICLLFNLYSSKFRIKLIFAIRNITWDKFFKPIFTKKLFSSNLDKESNSKIEYYLQPFSESEYRIILNTVINTNKNKNLIFSIANDRFKDLLRIPINLSLVVNSLKSGLLRRTLTPLTLFSDLMEKYIFKSTFAEEKVDIILKLIELIDFHKQGYFVNKNELKKYLPIHLKTKGDYYFAYNELLSSGIISEIRDENIHGLSFINIQFNHINFYYYLSALFHIENNGKLNFELIKEVALLDNLEYVSNVLAWLYQIAYYNENFEAIKEFFTLKDDIFETLNLWWPIGACFRDKNSITEKLIKHYSTNSRAHKYLFESFVDENYLMISYINQIEYYGKVTHTQESQMFSNTIYFLYSFLNLDKESCIKYDNELSGLDYNENIFPWPIARKLSYSILNDSFINGKIIKYETKKLLEIRKIAYANVQENFIQELYFETIVSLSLILVKEYNACYNFIEKVSNLKQNDNCEQHKLYYRENNKKLLSIFIRYSKYKIEKLRDDNLVEDCIQFIEEYYQSNNSFQFKIIVLVILIDLMQEENSLDKALEYANEALLLSEFAEYHFFKAKILYNWPVHDNEKKLLAEELIMQSQFNKELF